MKRNLLIILSLIIISIFVLAACDGGGEPKTSDPPAQVTEDPNKEPTPEPTATPEPGPTVYLEEDFENEENFEMPLLSDWIFRDAGGKNNSQVKEEKDGNKYFFVTGFINMPFYLTMEEAYLFAFDVKGTHSADMAGAFVKGNTLISLPVGTNPQGAEYFEDDGSSKKGFTSTTGIGLWFTKKNEVTLYVKTNDTSEKEGIGNAIAYIECDYATNAWNRVEIADDFEGSVKFYINGQLIAIVEYSDLGEYDNVFQGEEFYKKAQIKDAEGNILAETDKAFICKIGEPAFGLRAAALSLDNILIKTLEEGDIKEVVATEE